MKNKEKYILNEIVIKVAETQCTHTIEALYENKIVYKRSYLVDNGFKKITDFFNWLEQEYKPPILDDVEKAYLSAVIKPFRKGVRSITKQKNNDGYEWLRIIVEDNNPLVLPGFKKETMYKGMHAYKEYTVEELGL
nr:MAG TPA: hypothetical protein [Bacteriophage sp.]